MRERVITIMSRIVHDNARSLRLKIEWIRERNVPWKIVKWFLVGLVEYHRKFLAQCFSGCRTESQLTDR